MGAVFSEKRDIRSVRRSIDIFWYEKRLKMGLQSAIKERLSHIRRLLAVVRRKHGTRKIQESDDAVPFFFSAEVLDFFLAAPFR
jgi:hypothetical protein